MASFQVSTAAFNGEFQGNATPARLTVASTGNAPTAEDQRHLLGFLNRVMLANVPFIAVYDLRVWGMPSPTLLKGLGEWCKAHEKEMAPLQKAVAILLTNNFWSSAVKKMIGVVTAICPPACPLLMCHSLESAESFIAEKTPAPAAHQLSDDVSKNPSQRSNCSCDIDLDEDPLPCQPPRFADVRLLQTSPDACLSQADETMGHEKSCHFVDLDDLHDDAMLFKRGNTEDLDGDARATELISALRSAGLPLRSAYLDSHFNGHVLQRTRSHMQPEDLDEPDMEVTEEACNAQPVPFGPKRSHTRTGLHLRSRLRRHVRAML